MHIYIYTNIHKYIYTYVHTCIYTNMHIYIHTYIHIYMYAYIQVLSVFLGMFALVRLTGTCAYLTWPLRPLPKLVCLKVAILLLIAERVVALYLR
jgi:hypothetical protein